MEMHGSDEGVAIRRMLTMTAARRDEVEQELESSRDIEHEYSVLATSLRELPRKVESEVLVPFGKLAFFPGTLQHTNEVTVLLGESYFAKCSAEKAAQIAEHRTEHARPRVSAAQEELDALTQRIEQLRALGKLSGGLAPGEFEIREPCDDDGGPVPSGSRGPLLGSGVGPRAGAPSRVAPLSDAELAETATAVKARSVAKAQSRGFSEAVVERPQRPPPAPPAIPTREAGMPGGSRGVAAEPAAAEQRAVTFAEHDPPQQPPKAKSRFMSGRR